MLEKGRKRCLHAYLFSNMSVSAICPVAKWHPGSGEAIMPEMQKLGDKLIVGYCVHSHGC